MMSPSDPPEENKFRAEIEEDQRPWGKFRSYPVDAVSSLKIITVKPGGTLSLQYHNHRREFWVVLDPGLEVTVGDEIRRAQPGEEIYIPAGSPHRLRCRGELPARIMEVWLGDSSEDDIVRLDDAYGRS